jgi:hypothetical protein
MERRRDFIQARRKMELGHAAPGAVVDDRKYASEKDVNVKEFLNTVSTGVLRQALNKTKHSSFGTGSVCNKNREELICIARRDWVHVKKFIE